MAPAISSRASLANNPVRQFVLVFRIPRKMPGEEVPDLLDGADEGIREPPFLQQTGHARADLPPEGVPAFLVHAGVTHDGKLARPRGDINQDRVAVAGPGHAQGDEPFLSDGQRVRPPAARNIDADFTGTLPFGLSDGIDDPRFIQLIDKLLRLHSASPTAAGAPAAKTPAAA